MREFNSKKEEQYKSELINSSERLWQISRELIDLELNDQVDTQEFKEKIAKVRRIIDFKEDNLYEEIGSNLDIAYHILMSFENDTENFDDEIRDVKEDRKENLICSRILKLLNAKILEKDRNIKGISRVRERINKAIDEDIVKTILTILNQYLTDINLSNIKDYLLQIKYNLIFAFPSVAESLLEDSCRLNYSLFWQRDFIAHYLGVSSETLKSYYENKIKQLLLDSIYFITDQFNLNLREKDVLERVTVCQLFIRAAILFMSDSEVEDLQKRFTILTEIKQMLSDEKSGEEKVLEALKMYESDRELPISVTLNKAGR